jgi:hypothetical protein
MRGLTTASSFMRISRWYGGHRTACIVLVYLALAVLLVIPILVARVPLGVDDLNHLARIHVRAHISTDPDLVRLFEFRAGMIPYPYLGMDLLLTPLARLLPTMIVGRIYVLAMVWGLVGVVAVLQRAFTSRVGLGPAAAGLIAYNSLIAWGFLNYMLGLILALLLFAAWHCQRSQLWLTRLVLFTGAATVLYLTHLVAFVLYGIMVGSYELFGRARPLRTPLRDWLVLAGQAVPALLLWGALATKLPGTDFAFHYLPLDKVLILESPFLFRGARGGLDTGLITVVFCAATLLLGLRRGWLAWPRTLVGPVLVLLVLTIALPFRIFGVAFIDYRFALAAACLALAGLKPSSQALSHAIPVAAGLALLTVVHVADVAILMHHCDAQYSELQDALALLPRGADLTTVLERTEPAPDTACTSLPIYEHIAQLVTIDRSGYAPDFFAHITSIAVRGGRPTDTDPASAGTFNSRSATGYVLWITLGRRRPVPPDFVLLRRGSFFDLWDGQD